LVGRTAYFFFAVFFTAFLAAFFAGAFLAAFLVAICLFSLFDGLHRFCNRYIAVEECIESPSIDVKKKTTEEWKNKQQFFQDEFQFVRAFSKIIVLKIIFEARESNRKRKNNASATPRATHSTLHLAQYGSFLDSATISHSSSRAPLLSHSHSPIRVTLTAE
jgi:hypothetical protein